MLYMNLYGPQLLYSACKFGQVFLTRTLVLSNSTCTTFYFDCMFITAGVDLATNVDSLLTAYHLSSYIQHFSKWKSKSFALAHYTVEPLLTATPDKRGTECYYCNK